MLGDFIIRLNSDENLKRTKPQVEAFFRVKFSFDSYKQFLKAVVLSELNDIEARAKNSLNSEIFYDYDNFLEQISLIRGEVQKDNYNQVLPNYNSNEVYKVVQFMFGRHGSLVKEVCIIKGSILASAKYKALADSFVDNTFSKKEIEKFKEFYFFFLIIKTLERAQRRSYGEAYIFRSLFARKIHKGNFLITFDDYYSYQHLRMRDNALTRKALSVLNVFADYVSKEDKEEIFNQIAEFVRNVQEGRLDRTPDIRNNFLMDLSETHLNF